MIRCPSCQLMNMREDEERGVCYQCGQSLASTATHGSPAAGNQLLSWLGVVLGVALLSVGGWVAWMAREYDANTRQAVATVRKDFHTTSTTRGFDRTYNVGYYTSNAEYWYQGTMYTCPSNGGKAGEQFTVYFQANEPGKVRSSRENMFWLGAGLAALFGCVMVVAGGIGLALNRPRSANAQDLEPAAEYET